MISIITINYNDKKGLEKTLSSIKSQIFKQIELIIIDGNSNDGSKIIIDRYDKIITKKIIEKDNGIYDAMNKGIKLATGDFLFFLNSGDTLLNDLSLNNVSKKLTKKNNGYFFNAIIKSHNLEYKSPRKYNKKYYKINNKFIPNHQAVLFPRIFYSKNLYDISMKICSDVDYIFRLSLSNNLYYFDINFVYFELGGVSSNFKKFSKTLNQIREASYIFSKYKPFRYDILMYIKAKFIIKFFLHNLFSSNYYKIIKFLNRLKN